MMNLDDWGKMYGLEIHYPDHVYRQFTKLPNGQVVFNPTIEKTVGATSIVLRSFQDGQPHVAVAIPAGAKPFYKRRTIRSHFGAGPITAMWFLVGYEQNGIRYIDAIDAISREVTNLQEPVANDS